ncbi:MAG: D-aminoacylase, partial [Actinomycetales bacterium]
MTRRTVVSGGVVVDGTGAVRRQADLLLVDDRIDAVVGPGELAGADARHVDASGLVVAPGFIDVHSHADGSFLLDGDASKILQGVTSEIVGNCGASLAPLGAATSHPTADRLVADGTRPTWQSVADLVEAGQDRHVTHVGTLVGHGTLRELVGGHASQAIDDHQRTAMRLALAAALESGAFGLSSGLVYAPGVFAPESELESLVEVLGAEHVYATHLRNESDQLMESIEEALRTTATTDAHVQISHLKATGRRNHGSTATALRRLDRARADGRTIGQDVYPYTAASTALTACLPPWALAGGTMALLARLADAGMVARLRAEVQSAPPHPWENPVASAHG